MQPHIINYFEGSGLDTTDFVPCEVCGSGESIDIHHIIPRSKFGSKRKDEQDHYSNLIALCRKHHEDAHANKIIKEELQTIVQKRG